MTIIESYIHAARNPEAVFAMLEGGETITYKKLLENTDRAGLLFSELRLQPGDKILLATRDKASYAELLIAAYRAGITVILLDPNARILRARNILAEADPQVCFVDEELQEEWQLQDRKVLHVKKVFRNKRSIFKKVFAAAPARPGNISDTYPAILEKFTGLSTEFPETIDQSSGAYIMYTSGTTSSPKGVLISHKNLFSHLGTLKSVFRLDDTSRILNLLNLFHADGVNLGPMLAFYLGATWLFPFPLNIARLDLIYNAVYKYKVSHFIAVPTMLALFERYHEGYEDSFQTPDFRFIVSVSARLDTGLWENLSRHFKVRIINVYGLTETVSGSLFCGPSDENFRIGTVGKPVDCMIRIINEEGHDTAVSEKGELLLKGDHIMSGYYNATELTSRVMKNGWLYTGDIAEIDTDGFISIVGRKKNMINAGGFNIHPEEIEEILLMHPAVQECMVVGIDDHFLIEKAVACIQLKEGAMLSETPAIRFLQERLEPEKIPQEVLFFSDLPRGISGKIIKADLLKLIEGIHCETDSSGSDILKTVIQVAERVFRLDRGEVTESSTAVTVSGWDSLNHFVLINELEDIYKQVFTTAEIMGMISIRSIAEVLSRKVS